MVLVHRFNGFDGVLLSEVGCKAKRKPTMRRERIKLTAGEVLGSDWFRASPTVVIYKICKMRHSSPLSPRTGDCMEAGVRVTQERLPTFYGIQLTGRCATDRLLSMQMDCVHSLYAMTATCLGVNLSAFKFFATVDLVLADSFTSALRWLSAYRFALEPDLQPSNPLKRCTRIVLNST